MAAPISVIVRKASSDLEAVSLRNMKASINESSGATSIIAEHVVVGQYMTEAYKRNWFTTLIETSINRGITMSAFTTVKSSCLRFGPRVRMLKNMPNIALYKSS